MQIKEKVKNVNNNIAYAIARSLKSTEGKGDFYFYHDKNLDKICFMIVGDTSNYQIYVPTQQLIHENFIDSDNKEKVIYKMQKTEVENKIKRFINTEKFKATKIKLEKDTNNIVFSIKYINKKTIISDNFIFSEDQEGDKISDLSIVSFTENKDLGCKKEKTMGLNDFALLFLFKNISNDLGDNIFIVKDKKAKIAIPEDYYEKFGSLITKFFKNAETRKFDLRLESKQLVYYYFDLLRYQFILSNEVVRSRREIDICSYVEDGGEDNKIYLVNYYYYEDENDIYYVYNTKKKTNPVMYEFSW